MWRLVVASQASLLYRDRAKGRSFTPRQIAEACEPMVEGIVHQQCDGVWLAPAEVYGLVVALVAGRVRNDKWPDGVSYRYLDGPPALPFSGSPRAQASTIAPSVTLDDLFGACLYEDAYLNACGQMPAQVQVGPRLVVSLGFPGDDRCSPSPLAGVQHGRVSSGERRFCPGTTHSRPRLVGLACLSARL